MTDKLGTTFTGAVQVKPLDNDTGPKFRIESGLQASAAVTASQDVQRYVHCQVITTAGTTVAGKIAVFTI